MAITNIVGGLSTTNARSETTATKLFSVVSREHFPLVSRINFHSSTRWCGCLKVGEHKNVIIRSWGHSKALEVYDLKVLESTVLKILRSCGSVRFISMFYGHHLWGRKLIAGEVVTELSDRFPVWSTIRRIDTAEKYSELKQTDRDDRVAVRDEFTC